MPARRPLRVCVEEGGTSKLCALLARMGGGVPAHRFRSAASIGGPRMLAASAPSRNRLYLAESLGSRGRSGGKKLDRQSQIDVTPLKA
jgi:hypothetical protein